MCIRLSKNICNVCFNHSTCLTIIITVTTMRNRPEESDSWDVIDNLDIEAEQQSFLLIAAVALSFLESYDETRSQCKFQNGSINELTGMCMSQESFFMRIDFNVNIACLLKLAINYWNSFNLPSQLMLLNQMQVPVYTAQISIFILS